MTDKRKQEIVEALEVINGRSRTGAPQGLSGAIARLDASKDAEWLDPQLRHYLQKRSYAKALAWLEEGRAEHGTCGGKR